jgi:hypothetical protein
MIIGQGYTIRAITSEELKLCNDKKTSLSFYKCRLRAGHVHFSKTVAHWDRIVRTEYICEYFYSFETTA